MQRKKTKVEQENIEKGDGKVLLTHEKPNVVFEGQHAHFTHHFKFKHDLGLKINWSHNGQLLPTSTRIKTKKILGSVFLDIMNVKKADAGTYIIDALNNCNQKTAIKLILKVKSCHRPSEKNSTGKLFLEPAFFQFLPSYHSELILAHEF